MAVMTVIRSAILNHSQKELVKDAILSYVTNLQKRYFKRQCNFRGTLS